MSTAILWQFGGCLSFRIVSQLQRGILSSCFHAHCDNMILHKWYYSHDQRAYAWHSLTTFSTHNNSWVLSSLGSAVHELLNFKSGPCISSMSEMNPLEAGTALQFLMCLCSQVQGRFISPKHFWKSPADPQDSPQLSPANRHVLVEWTEPSATRNSCAFHFAYLLPSFLFANAEDCCTQFC